CIIDQGILINHNDIRRLLGDLGYVRYHHTIDGITQSEGEGWILEIFNDPHQSTLIANGSIYLNLQSFDYLQLYSTAENQVYFDLVQDNRQLRLIPLSPTQQEKNHAAHLVDRAVIEEMVTQVLSAKWDVELDEEDY
ncbi:MAG: hypothetical protein D6756_09840, partial [Cyanobacteria bacterium J083]